jgi:HAD superfamily hydrolase (TIGR01509 family)
MAQAGAPAMTVWICDVNGVLVDTVAAVREAFAATAAHGGFSFTETDFQIVKGLPLLDAYRRLAPGSDAARWRRVHLRFIHDQLPRIAAYPEVADVFAEAAEAGVRVGATTSHGEIAEGCLVRTKLYSFIDCLVTQEEVTRPKPDPESLHRALDLLGVDPRDPRPKNVLFVGDTAEDIEAGRAAGVQTVGVTYGVSDDREIRRARPDHVIHAFGEMRSFLPRHPRAYADGPEPAATKVHRFMWR